MRSRINSLGEEYFMVETFRFVNEIFYLSTCTNKIHKLASPSLHAWKRSTLHDPILLERHIQVFCRKLLGASPLTLDQKTFHMRNGRKAAPPILLPRHPSVLGPSMGLFYIEWGCCSGDSTPPQFNNRRSSRILCCFY